MKLRRLAIEGVGLIERAEIEFADGFTAFTGETGSGKSMLLGALGLALGERAERDAIRDERARVQVTIEPDAALRAWCEEAGLALAQDDDVIVVRDVFSAGRTSVRMNGLAVSVTQLREFGARVAEVVGQGEAHRLFEPAYARDALDRYAGGEALVTRDRIAALVMQRRTLLADLEAFTASATRASAERDDAVFGLGDIDAVAPQPGEDETLRVRRDALIHAERIAAGLAAVNDALERDGGAVDTLGDALHALTALERFGDDYSALARTAASLQSDAGALAADVARHADAIEAQPEELETLTTRIAELDRLKKKYGGSLDAVALARERFAALLERDASRDERAAELARQVAAVDRDLANAVDRLRALRRAAAERCAAALAIELPALALPAARVAIEVAPLDEIAAHGADHVIVTFSANPGEPLRPIARIASGGERSRVLLALVLVLAAGDEPRAFVFDEVDAGIGGATATAVGVRLARLATHTQVLCVTHLAQIAAHAQAHYVLRKDERGGRTVIDVVPLQADESRLAEIARMLSGNATATALDLAASLQQAARAAR